jgi:serine/threonine-protein kinase SRPK3
MFSFTDDLDPAFAEFEEEEIRIPCPRKEVKGRFIYVSRELAQPKGLGPPVLCDLGNAVDGQVKHIEDMQPDVYRSPEMILGISWSYKIDIWNVGCMVCSLL